MNRFALLTLYRSLTRHKLYAALNIGGLAVGIAVFLVLSLYARFETSYEKWLPRYDRIYLVQSVWNMPGQRIQRGDSVDDGRTAGPDAGGFPGTVGTRVRGGEDAGSVVRSGAAVSEDVAQVDPTFFDVFDLPMAQGDGRAALTSPANAIISESAAKKYFGSSDPIGQTMTVAMDSANSYRVAGVFRDLPKNSEFKLSILIPLAKTPPTDNWYHWGSSQLQTFLRFETPEAARAFERKTDTFVDRRATQDMGKDASEDAESRPVADRALASGADRHAERRAEADRRHAGDRRAADAADRDRQLREPRDGAGRIAGARGRDAQGARRGSRGAGPPVSWRGGADGRASPH